MWASQSVRHLGASLGNDIAHNRSNDGYDEMVGRCELTERVKWREDVVGYDVGYRYQGEIYHTRLPYNPGNSIEVKVDVTQLG